MGYPLQKRTKIFISYSHKDAKHLARLHIHLADLERSGAIIPWSDTKITPGADWHEEIKNAIDTASVAVLLISADFLASQFIADNELPPLLELAAKAGTIILPVILSPCGYEYSNVSQFQAVNSPSKPLTKMSSHQKEELWAKVAKEIRETVMNIAQRANENKKRPQINPTFHVSYGTNPGQATIRTDNQFIVVIVRKGSVEQYMLDIAKEVLEDIERISQMLNEREFLMFRGMWVDDRNGNVELFIDLIHDIKILPTLKEKEIKEIFHDGIVWYVHNQGITVSAAVIKAFTASDSFSPRSSEYYERIPWLQSKN